MNALEPLFQALLRRGPEGIEDIVFVYPVLFGEGTLEQMGVWGQRVAAPESTMEAVIAGITSLRSRIERKEIRYPFGQGPIDRIWSRASQGEITLYYALELVRRPDVYERLAAIYVDYTCLRTRTTARSGNWLVALQVHELLLASLEARAPDPARLPEQSEMWWTAAIAWLYIVPFALVAVPDGRIFRRAVSIALDLLKTDLSESKRGEVFRRLGVIHLDPYVAMKSPRDYDLQYASWQKELVRALGDDYESLRQEAAMPLPEQALRTAEDWLRQAEAVEKNAELGLTLKALAQTIYWRHELGWRSDVSDLPGIVDRALTLLPESLFPGTRAELELYRGIGKARFLEESLPDLIRQYGTIGAAQLFASRAQNLPPEEAQRALTVWSQLWKLLDEVDEDVRFQHLEIGLRLVRDAWADPLASSDFPNPSGALETLLQAAAAGSWSPRRCAASMFWLAATACDHDQEEMGLVALVLVAKTDSDLVSQFDPLFTRVRADLWRGRAVNTYKAGGFSQAADWYWRAVTDYLELNLPKQAFDLLDYIDNLAKMDDVDVISSVLKGLYAYGLIVEEKTAGPGADALNKIGQTLMLNVQRNKHNIPELLVFLWQSAKGLSFASMRNAGRGVAWGEDPGLMGLRDSILQLTAREQAPTGIPEELLLTAYYSELEFESGKDPAQVRANLQRRFEGELNKRRIAESRRSLVAPIGIEDLQAALDAETVLVSYFVGGAADQPLSVSTLVVTREQVLVTHGLRPAAEPGRVRIQAEEQRAAANRLGPMVGNLRERLISEDPGSEEGVTPETAALLQAEFRNFFGGTLPEELLKMKKAGKQRLCIVPHGPLHYFPFHLLMNQGATLADDWLVTYLPDLRLIASAQNHAGTAPRRELTALGIGFRDGGPYGLPPLDNAESETRSIARLFQTEAITGANATEEAFVEALENSRRVHLATHGRHCVAAPSFQTIYLAPGERSDGRFHAFELLGRNLDGLELVTLSACETALGRFDIRDNLRGLPANLLLAGVRTIVGTLWSVETLTTGYFFREFYKEIHDGARVGKAFAEAQSRTRKLHPQFRDWGAFYLMGDV